MRLGSLDRLGSDARRTWAASRVWAAHRAPYLASALLALEPVVVDQRDDPPDGRADLTAFPVDGRWRVYLDPDVVAGTEVAVMGSWLVHQVSHLLRQHAARCPVPVPSAGGTAGVSARSDDHRRWNLAADAEVDDDLSVADLRLPSAAVRPGDLGLPEDRTAEEYFDTLGGAGPRDRARPGGGAGPAGSGGAPAPPPTGGPADQGATSGDCGSGCDDVPRPWEAGQGGLAPVGARLVEREVARRIREHQRRRGTVPAGWRRWADEQLEPTVRWQQLLRAEVRRAAAEVAGRVDFSYRKPSRRASSVTGVVLPTLRQPLPRVAMVLDTSGSMSDAMLGQALAEVDAVLRSMGVARQQLQVVCCDATAFEAQRVLRAHQVELLGGGGTDMGAGLAKATAARPRPDLVVVLTDGHTPWPPARPPGVRVVVGLMDPTGTVPPWARTIPVGLPPSGGAHQHAGSGGAPGPW